MDSLERLQGLHADLVAFSETRLANIDRLWQELEFSIQEFRRLLDKPTPTAAEREAYNSGKVTANEQEYGINDDFRHISRAVATALDLEELEGGKLWIEVRSTSQFDRDPTIADVVGHFQNRRDLLLQTLRLTLHESLNEDCDPPQRSNFQEIVAQVLDIRNGPPSNGSIFAARCLTAMEDIEKRQVQIGEQLQSRTIIGDPQGAESYATLEFQRDSLFKQHEALGCILASLYRGNYTISEDLRRLSNVLRRMNRLDFYLIHYLPAFAAGFRQYGTPDGATSQDDSKSLNRHFTSSASDGVPASIRPFKAVIELWWTVEYGAWFRDISDPNPETDACASVAKQAIQDSAMEFLVSICASMVSVTTDQSARQELILLILGDDSVLALDSEQTSEYFRLVLMESLENFVEAWITNMPDSIRKLKSEEDDQRLLQLTAIHEGLAPGPGPHPQSFLHLECLLVLISFAFEHRPTAAEQWWEDLDSNLYGFLQWASKRQTVPRVSAFCEMLISISSGIECATAAHKFLLDDSIAPASHRGRRVPSMNYAQMFAELELYANKVHERSVPAQVPTTRITPVTSMNELESPLMLSCYLRLLAHICRQTDLARQYIFGQSPLNLPRTLLKLSSGPVPTYLRASVFQAIEALLTDKDYQIAVDMWKTIDDWGSMGHDSGNQSALSTGQVNQPSMAALQNTLASISMSFDQYDAFIVLLRSLTSDPLAMRAAGQLLPFPTDLGSAYRSPGIGPYIDMLCGQVMLKRLRDLGEDPQGVICSYHCLDLIATCLEGFNENYVAMMDRSKTAQDGSNPASGEMLYAERHPFSRLMRWLLGTDISKILMKTMHVSLESVQSSPFGSPRILNLERCIDVINLVIELQPTYFDIVRPMTKENLRNDAFVSANITPIEETLAAHPGLALDLCRYASTDHLQLVMRSLALLQKLSKSAKLNNHFLPTNPQNDRARRVIDMFGPNGSSELVPVAQVMSSRLRLDIRELEDGFESSGYSIKDGILSFFNACLDAQPNLPSTAHLLLGFEHVSDKLTISNSIDNGVSVFNIIIDLMSNYPDGEDGSMESWLVHIKAAAAQVLRHLWSADISAGLVLGQLRRLRFLSNQFTTQSTIATGPLWDGIALQDPSFWYSTAGEGLIEFLNLRGALYGYITTELKAASRDNLVTVLKQTFNTLYGQSSDIDGTPIRHATIFDFFDFLNLDLKTQYHLPKLEYFQSLDVEGFRIESADDAPSLYNIAFIHEKLQVEQNRMLSSQQTPGSKGIDVDKLNLEADAVVASLEANNRWTLATKAHANALKNYVDMIIAVLDHCPIEVGQKNQFIIQMLQLILPKFDSFILSESSSTYELARATDALLFALTTTPEDRTRPNQSVTEKLFQFFRTSTEGITASTSDSGLRQVLYSICAQYLQRLTETQEVDSPVIRKACSFSMDCIRTSGLRLINVLSDDAEDGTDICRLNAFNLLALMTSLARVEKSTFMVDSFVKANVLEILIEPLKNVAVEFQDAAAANMPRLLSIFQARMLLLLHISRTREGATAIFDAGFVPALRASELFQTDPDLGISLALEKSLGYALGHSDRVSTVAPGTLALARQNYYILISSTLRVLLATATSRGAQNEQVQFVIRSFLSDYRHNMLGLFKKQTGINGKISDVQTNRLLSECVKSYVGLATLSGFIELESANGADYGVDGVVSGSMDVGSQGGHNGGMGLSLFGTNRGFS